MTMQGLVEVVVTGRGVASLFGVVVGRGSALQRSRHTLGRVHARQCLVLSRSTRRILNGGAGQGLGRGFRRFRVDSARLRVFGWGGSGANLGDVLRIVEIYLNDLVRARQTVYMHIRRRITIVVVVEIVVVRCCLMVIRGVFVVGLRRGLGVGRVARRMRALYLVDARFRARGHVFACRAAFFVLGDKTRR